MSKKDLKQKKGNDSMNKARKDFREPEAGKVAQMSNQNSLNNKKLVKNKG